MIKNGFNNTFPGYVLIGVACSAMSIICACGGNRSGNGRIPTPLPNPQPSLISISPSLATVGAQALTLVINGSGFTSGSVVQWNGQTRTTSFNSSSQLTAMIPASDLGVAGTVPVTVFTPSPGGGTSNALTIVLNNPKPVVTSVDPGSLVAGGAATLLLLGSGFVANSVAKWNGIACPTSFVGSTQVSVSLSDADTITPQLNSLVVTNSSPGGGNSNAVLVATNSNRPPSLALLVPMSATAGASQFELRVYGQDLSPNSIVQWNGALRTTRFVKPGLVVASVSAMDISNIGTVTVTVTAPRSSSVRGKVALLEQISTLPFAIQSSANPQLLQRVSTADDGTDLYGTMPDPTVVTTIDGRYVAFASTARLTPDTSGYLEVFVRDTCAGVPNDCSPSTIHASVAIPGSNRASGGQVPSISADGRYVSFDGAQLDPEETIVQANVYVRDTCINAIDPCTPSTQRVSRANDGSEGNAMSHSGRLTPDARYVAFDSDASNLVANDTNGITDVFVRDTCIGAPGGCVPGTVRVSVADDGTQANDASGAWVGVLSIGAEGRYVSFASRASNLTALPGPTPAIFVRDTVAPMTFRASVANDGTPLRAFIGNMSGDGRYVVFESSDAYVSPPVCSVPSDVPPYFLNHVPCTQIFVRDTCINAPATCSPSTRLLTVAANGQAATGNSFAPSIGTDGRFVAFLSDAADLVADDTNATRDLFIRDTCASAPEPCTPSTVRLSVRTDGSQTYGYVFPGPASAVSAYGRFIAFPGPAELMPGKTLGGDDVFLARSPF